jgi:opacity protein-like surface antigen
MKLRILVVALLGLVLAAPPAFAAAPIWLGADLGLSIPIGDYKDEASLGLLAGLTGTYMFTDYFGLGGDIALHSPGVADDFEEAQAAEAGATVDVSLRAIQVTPHARFLIPTRGTVQPYLKGGLGLYNLGSRIEGGSLDVDESKTKFGFNLGVGAQTLATSVVAFGGELAYHSISTDGSATSMLTLTAGVRFGVGSR